MSPRIEEMEVGYPLLPKLCMRTLGDVWNTGLSWIVSIALVKKVERGSELEICMWWSSGLAFLRGPGDRTRVLWVLASPWI